jgi:hypothetical protein
MEVAKPKRQPKAPDPHAPRFVKVEFDILNKTNKEFYAAMKKQYPELEQYTDTEITNCITFFNKRIGTEVLSNRNGVRLSDGLGVIVAGATKLSSQAIANNIDYNALRKGMIVLHQNHESEQHIGKIKYSSEIDKHMFENYNMWCFDAARPLTRALAAEFKKEGAYKNYIIFSLKQNIAHLFRKQKIQKVNAIAQENRSRKLQEHNEFDI